MKSSRHLALIPGFAALLLLAAGCGSDGKNPVQSDSPLASGEEARFTYAVDDCAPVRLGKAADFGSDAVVVSAQEREGATLYEVRVHPTDAGKVIGKQGATIHAIRALLQAGAAKQGTRCAMELVEERSER